MIPWAILCAINGDLNLGIAIIILLVIMSVIRQLLEPKLVSKNIGIHPIFTLIAMYTGFTKISMYPKLFESDKISYSELLDILINYAINKFDFT